MKLHTLLNIQPGITALIGGGGKTTMMYTLAEELAVERLVVCCTTTHIAAPDHLSVLTDAAEAQLRTALREKHCVCIGQPATNRKLTAPALPMKALAELADYVLVEADGSRGLPCKAHRSYEPVIPPETGLIISLLGASCFGRPVREVVHRPEEFWFATALESDDPVTPEAAAELLQTEVSTAWPPIKLFINQVEDAGAWDAARRMAELLPWPVYAGALKRRCWTCLP